MGNLRSVEKALERVGAEARITAIPRRRPSADGVVLPGVGAFPKAMERVRELGLDELVARADSTRAGRCSASAWACSCCSSPRPSSRARRGWGCSAGPVAPISANGYKVPHIGWSPVRWEHASRADRGPRRRPPFYFVHSFVPGRLTPADVLGTAAYGERFACAVERPPLLRRAVPPREVERGGPADARELRADLPRRRVRPRRAGKRRP